MLAIWRSYASHRRHSSVPAATKRAIAPCIDPVLWRNEVRTELTFVTLIIGLNIDVGGLTLCAPVLQSRATSQCGSLTIPGLNGERSHALNRRLPALLSNEARRAGAAGCITEEDSAFSRVRKKS